jgi:hypothetical protein
MISARPAFPSTGLRICVVHWVMLLFIGYAPFYVTFDLFDAVLGLTVLNRHRAAARLAHPRRGTRCDSLVNVSRLRRGRELCRGCSRAR